MPQRKQRRPEVAESVAPAEYRATVKEWPVELRPRERLQHAGADQLPDAELLAIILRTGVQGQNVVDLSNELLRRRQGLAGLDRLSFTELCEETGLGPAKAAEIKAALELGRRLVTMHPAQRAQVSSPEDIWNLVYAEMAGLEQEHLKVLLLNTKNQVLAAPTIYKGSLNSTTVRVGELFKAAIRENAASIALAHNHPSGDPTPSPEDAHLTRDAVSAGRLMGIEVLDHIVVGRGPRAFVSLRAQGLGFPPGSGTNL